MQHKLQYLVNDESAWSNGHRLAERLENCLSQRVPAATPTGSLPGSEDPTIPAEAISQKPPNEGIEGVTFSALKPYEERLLADEVSEPLTQPADITQILREVGPTWNPYWLLGVGVVVFILSAIAIIVAGQLDEPEPSSPPPINAPTKSLATEPSEPATPRQSLKPKPVETPVKETPVRTNRSPQTNQTEPPTAQDNLRRLEKKCDGGNGRACYRLSKRYKTRPNLAEAFTKRACALGIQKACPPELK